MATSIKSLLSRPATIPLGRRHRHHCYQRIDKLHQEEEKDICKSFFLRSPFKNGGSKSNGDQGGGLIRSELAYPPYFHSDHLHRMERAKKRQIFLRSYNLSFEEQRPKTAKRRLRVRPFCKVKKSVLTIMAFARMRFLWLMRQRKSCQNSACLPSVFSVRRPPPPSLKQFQSVSLMN